MSTATLFDSDAPDRSRGIWDYISPSRINLWLKCPLAFRLRYIDGVETPAAPAQFIGRAVHSALETYYRHRQLGLTLGADNLSRRLDEHWHQTMETEPIRFDTTEDERASRQQAIELTTAYLAQLPADEPRPMAVEAALEAPLIDPSNGENLGIPLLGVIDLVLPERDGPMIADFKTTARGGELIELANEIQLSSYAYLFRQIQQQPEHALEIRNLVKTKTPRIEYHRYRSRTDKHFRRLFAVVRTYLDDLDRGRFVIRPGHACSMCEHRKSRCLSWAG